MFGEPKNLFISKENLIVFENVQTDFIDIVSGLMKSQNQNQNVFA